MRRGSLVVALLALGAGAAWVAWEEDVLWPSHPPAGDIATIDVARFQGKIDWTAVRADGVSGAWLKASEGGDLRDSRFDENRKAAHQAGLPWGAYHFLTFCRPVDDQVANFLGALDGDRGELPPAVDVETGGNCAAVPPPDELRGRVERFTSLVRAAVGREVLVYVIADQVQALFGGAPPGPLWIRSLYRRPDLADVHVWQYHCRGHVAGIEGSVDRDSVPPDVWRSWGLSTDGSPAPPGL